MSNLVKKLLKVEGMHCSSCAMSIDFALEDLMGVKNVGTSYARQEIVIEFDVDLMKIEDILLVVEKLGYKAVLKDNL